MYCEMENFYILDSQCFSYKAVVVSTCSESLSDSFDNIANLLSEKKIAGKVLLDYFLSNNSQKKRFYEIKFNGTQFDLKSFKKTQVPVSVLCPEPDSLSQGIYRTGYPRDVQDICASQLPHYDPVGHDRQSSQGTDARR